MTSSGKQYDPLEELDALETPRSNAKPAMEMKKSEKTAEKKSANSTGGSWFGGLFSKLAPKPKNQMILPDDSNPTVRIYCIIYMIQLIKELCDSFMFYVVKDSRGYFW